ncbi:MAG: hypothetical protein WDZ26_01935 [Nitriliruptoraceae bacterium]
MPSGLAELLAPTRCLACGTRDAGPWCASCVERLVAPVDTCLRCAAAGRPGHPCWPPGAPVDATRAVYDYRSVAARGIRTAKLGGAHRAWETFGALLGDAIRRHPVDVDVVTWVPTPPRRARRRDGDHARRLGIAVARALDLPCGGLLAADPSRRGDRYRFVHDWALPASSVLLVDDVVTTGRTAARAASVLCEAGADSVVLGVVARAGSHPLLG